MTTTPVSFEWKLDELKPTKIITATFPLIKMLRVLFKWNLDY